MDSLLEEVGVQYGWTMTTCLAACKLMPEECRWLDNSRTRGSPGRPKRLRTSIVSRSWPTRASDSTPCSCSTSCKCATWTTHWVKTRTRSSVPESNKPLRRSSRRCNFEGKDSQALTTPSRRTATASCASGRSSDVVSGGGGAATASGGGAFAPGVAAPPAGTSASPASCATRPAGARKTTTSKRATPMRHRGHANDGSWPTWRSRQARQSTWKQSGMTAKAAASSPL
mmetsp:Transcript_85879/g.262790  ORF Transcript_85879/g.262790 Transcript_85879/m.262790 type:complete len:228 (+) Transcript_85879:210-893(+)